MNVATEGQSKLIEETADRLAPEFDAEAQQVVAMHATAIIRELQTSTRTLRDQLLFLRTLLSTPQASEVIHFFNPAIAEAAFIELAALAHTLPNYPTDPEAGLYLGRPCSVCQAPTVDVERPTRLGGDRVLICANGHRTIPAVEK